MGLNWMDLLIYRFPSTSVTPEIARPTPPLIPPPPLQPIKHEDIEDEGL